VSEIPKYKVGERFTHSRECDRYRPIYYAAASGDFNPIHIDPEAGAAVGLGGAILHGMCTMAWAVESAVSYFGDPARIRRVKVRFSRPVMIGDVITFEGRVAEISTTHVAAEITAKNQRGEEVLKGAVVEFSISEKP
jgi:3-hydroxybutyryl-CoA dehydratase